MTELLPIDLNCDMGENGSEEGLANDLSIMPYVTAINVACGFHAGDKETMTKTVKAGLRHGISIGAHPGFDDREGFGRREMNLIPSEIYDLVARQVRLMKAVTASLGASLSHVKPHGALYNMAARSASMADAVADAVYDADSKLILYGLSGSELIRSGKKKGLKVYQEIFADRTYQSNGSLTARNQPDALINDQEQAVAQVLQIIRRGTTTTAQGTEITLQADTVCLHSDGSQALIFAREIHNALKQHARHTR